MDSTWQWLLAAYAGYAWVFQIIFIILGTAIVHFVEGCVYRYGRRLVSRSKNYWDEAFLTASHAPLVVLIWVLGLCFGLHVLGVHTHDSSLVRLIDPAKRVLVIILLLWFSIRFVGRIETCIIEKRKREDRQIDETSVQALFQVLRLIAIVIALLVSLQIVGIPISGIIAFGGVGGLAVGFAAKDLLANFFGGMMVYLDRPFSVGDWIRSPDRQIEGTVERIGWRLTRIRTFDKRPLYVPNGTFLTIAVENATRMRNRRIKAMIGLRYDDAKKLEPVLADIEKMMQNHDEIDTTQTLFANFVEFGASSLNLMIYAFTKTTNWVEFQVVQQDVFLKALQIIHAHGAECAFPTQTLHINKPKDLFES